MRRHSPPKATSEVAAAVLGRRPEVGKRRTSSSSLAPPARELAGRKKPTDLRSSDCCNCVGVNHHFDHGKRRPYVRDFRPPGTVSEDPREMRPRPAPGGESWSQCLTLLRRRRSEKQSGRGRETPHRRLQGLWRRVVDDGVGASRLPIRRSGPHPLHGSAKTGLEAWGERGRRKAGWRARVRRSRLSSRASSAPREGCTTGLRPVAGEDGVMSPGLVGGRSVAPPAGRRGRGTVAASSGRGVAGALATNAAWEAGRDALPEGLSGALDSSK